MSEDFIDLPKINIFVDAPATPTSEGIPGQAAFDGTYLYVCIAIDTWKRIEWGAW